MASDVIHSLQYYRNLIAENNCEEVCNIREECCVLCKSCFEDEKSVSVSHKGILTIIKFRCISPSYSVESTETLENGADIDLVSKLDNFEADKICLLYNGIQKISLPLEPISWSKELLQLNECLLQYKISLCEKSPIARLWLQYMEYIETFKFYIRAERTDNWNLHLIAVERMLNLFAATDHVHYAKSAQLLSTDDS